MSNTETLSGIILWGIYIIVASFLLFIIFRVILPIVLIIISAIVEKIFPKAGKAIFDLANKISGDENY